jgi:uncharacterized membrane protein HdeD (DUF308 family)
MTAWRRWQDYATIVLGVLLFVSPFVFSDTSQSTASVTAYVLGVLIVLSGLLAAAMARANATEWIPVILGVITFISPWVFGFSAVTGVAWAAWVVGVLAVVSAGRLLLTGGSRRISAA